MRYLPLTPDERRSMLATIGARSIDDLFVDVPEAARLSAPVDLPRFMGEMQVERDLGRLAAKNMTASSVPFFVGAGAYKHHVPASVDHIIQRSEFLTSYTPYQPEIAQGTLQYLFEFQTQVAAITGMDVANASMYDGSTGTGEAVLMAMRVTKRNKAVVSGRLHPHYADVVHTVCGHAGAGMSIEIGGVHPSAPEDLSSRLDANTACVVVQNPDVFGNLADLRVLAEATHAAGALLIVVVTEAVSLGLVMSPGSMGADIVVAEGQSIGVGLQFGGPYVGLFATREKYMRQMPGRLCGRTVDGQGRPGFVLTLSTREQHIRREKATSNICTNSGLMCLAFTIHMTLLGEGGFKRLAQLNHEAACDLADALAELPGVEIPTRSYFNEFTLKLPKPAAGVVSALAKKGVLGGVPASRLYPGDASLENLLIVAATEVNTEECRASFVAALKEVLA
ncbi:MAG: aminomethyl-transferring glycine dehydrogenase subunit GcvPA [Alphaproteobacteria bacterium]|nr:aminomethyl-transferring glycine dehydrogenase subunit GcvPA [Alphaproteobacteria bacterium]